MVDGTKYKSSLRNAVDCIKTHYVSRQNTVWSAKMGSNDEKKAYILNKYVYSAFRKLQEDEFSSNELLQPP